MATVLGTMHQTGDIPFCEPTEVSAGETIKWKKRLNHYPATLWTLTYYLRCQGSHNPQFLASQDVVATADGNDHSVTISASDSALLADGQWLWIARVSNGTEVYKVDEGRLTIKPDFTQLAGGEDKRSIARRILEKLEAAWFKRASSDILNYVMPGTGMTIGKMTPEQMIKQMDYWKGEVAREDAAENLANGMGTGNNIKVKFVR